MNQKLLLSEKLDQLGCLMKELMQLIKEMDVKPRPMVAPGWVDGVDVMEALHISERTLQTLRNEHRLPYSMVGRKCYYKVEDVERLLKDNYQMFRLKLQQKEGGE